MISYSLKLCLTEVLINAAQIEKEIEFLREQLCLISDFHPYTAFKNIDRLSNLSKGQIEPSDIQMFLNNNGLKFAIEECRVFINNYDQDNDGRLSYSEFLKAILPFKNLELRQSISLKQPLQENFLLEQQEGLARLISKEIILTLDSEKIKQKLRSQPDFNMYHCFKAIDKYSTSRLLSEDIKAYLWQLGLIVTPEEVNLIFRRLDFYNDGVIDEKEFHKYMEIRNLQLIPQISNVTPKKSNIQDFAYKTPTKSSTQKKNLNNSGIDPTMSNILSVSKVQKRQYSAQPQNKNQRSISLQESGQNQTKTPQKYLQQKTKLRAQLELSKMMSEKKKSPPQKKGKQSLPRQKSVQKKKPEIPPAQEPGYFFASILMEIVLKEQQLEHKKIKLARQPEFNLYDGFRALDKDRVGYVASTDLDYFVQRRGQMSILVKKYGQNGRISRFSDFVKMTSPFSVEYQRYLDRKKPSHDSTKIPIEQVQTIIKQNFQYFQKDTLQQMRDVLEQLMENELNIDKLRNKIYNYRYPNLNEAFLMIDCYTRDEILSESDLEQYFYENQIKFNREDIELLLKKLDVDGDGIATKNDFICLLS